MNKNESSNNIVLAIETAVQGGSLSLLENGNEMDWWQGRGSISKSEDVLDEISRLLKKNNLKKSQIRKVVVSRGPGSFTGTRIGLAIGLGLRKSLSCEMFGVSVLEAMAQQAVSQNSLVTTAIPIGRQVCLQKFNFGQTNVFSKVTKPSLMSFEVFIQALNNEIEGSFVIYEKLYKMALENVQPQKLLNDRIVNCGENLAYLIGTRAKDSYASDNDSESPIYVQN